MTTHPLSSRSKAPSTRGTQEFVPSAPLKAPPAGTVEAWALDYIQGQDLVLKCAPPPPPHHWWNDRVETRGLRPGRPQELEVTRQRPKSIKRGALVSPRTRAALVHKFWHHELQAAELMAWALLRFPETPLPFRQGLLRILKDELRHMKLYEHHLQHLGYRLGDFAVRDWFWERVPTCASPVAFVALLGMGLEAANLEHTERFASWFRFAGDDFGAQIQEQVGREEVAHVRFATRWFRQWTGSVDFDTWTRALPPPLTPLLLRGKTLDRPRRLKAEMTEEFIARLSAWTPLSSG